MNDRILGDNSPYNQRYFSHSQNTFQLPFTVAARNSIDPIRVHSSTSSTRTASATRTSTKTDDQQFIQTSSATGEGSYQRSLTKNTSPRIIRNSGLQIGKGSEITLDRNLLQAIDTEQHAAQLTYRLTQQPQNGVLLLKGVVLTVGDRFSQADINSGWVSYRSISGVTQFTDNDSPKQFKGFAGQNIVWEAFDGNDWEIFIHNIVTNTTTQLTHNAFNDKVLGISGSNIVWSRALAKPVGNENELLRSTDNELLWFNGKTISHITHDGAIQNDLIALNGSNIFWESNIDTPRYSSQEFSFTNGKVRKRLTNHSQYKYVQAVQGAKIVWGSIGDPHGKATFPDQELFFFNGKTTTRLTHNRVNDSLARIDAPYIAWSSDIGPKIRKWRGGKAAPTTEIMLFNGKTTRRLTRNRIDDDVVGIDGSHVVWSSQLRQEGGFWQDDYPDLFLFDGKRQIRLTNNKIPDSLVSIDGSNVFWTSELNPSQDASQQPILDLFWFDGKTTRQLTNRGTYEEGPFVNVWAAHGSKLVWTTVPSDVSLTELFFFDGQKTTQITHNQVFESDALITNSAIAWFSSMGPLNIRGFPTSEVMACDIPTKNTQRLTTNDFQERNLQLSGSNLAWEGDVASGQSELFFANFASDDRFQFNLSDSHGGNAKGTFNITFSA